MRVLLTFDRLESRSIPSIFTPPALPTPTQQPLPVPMADVEPELPVTPLITVQVTEPPTLLDSLASAAQALLQSAAAVAPTYLNFYGH